MVNEIIKVIALIPVIVVGLVVAGLFLAFGGSVNTELQSISCGQFSYNSTDGRCTEDVNASLQINHTTIGQNLTNQVGSAMQVFGNFQTVIWIIGAILVIIALLMAVIQLVKR